MTDVQMNGQHPALDEELCWRAALARDERFNGAFVLAVRTTGIYCRPTCPARRPRRENVAFFATAAAAERAGFRACKRCQPQQSPSYDAGAELARRVADHIDGHLDEPLTLADLAAIVKVSPHHLQRTFKGAMGITPRQYIRARRAVSLKQQLRNGESVTDALYGAGYGSSSRLYEGADAELGMTPATYRKGGRGMRIGYTIVDSPLGRLLVGATERGVCAISLGESDATLEAALHSEYPAAEITPDEAGFGEWVSDILAHLAGTHPHLDLPIDTIATAFQRRVWQELCRIPYGETRTYGEIAHALGKPKAARAVGRACATNPVAIVVPCHRAVAEDGTLRGYGWGIERKRALLERERATTVQHEA